MKPLKNLFLFLSLFAAGAACAAQWSREPGAFELGVYAPPPAHASLYSFNDVFRLTVAGPAIAEYPLAALMGGAALAPLQAASGLAEFPMRVVAAEPQAAGYVFSIVAVREPEQWLVLFSGLALAGWVARRRLVHAI